MESDPLADRLDVAAPPEPAPDPERLRSLARLLLRLMREAEQQVQPGPAREAPAARKSPEPGKPTAGLL
jgi:hypothetical protein